jgi:Spy/CpxP family protein refolding chaperone
MNRTFIAASIVALGVAATVPYIDAAQDQPQQAQGERVRRGHGPMGRGGRMGGPMAGSLGFPGIIRDLTDQQRDQVKAIREKHAEQNRPLAERARTAREALSNAVISGKTANLQALSIEVGNAATS